MNVPLSNTILPRRHSHQRGPAAAVPDGTVGFDTTYDRQRLHEKVEPIAVAWQGDAVRVELLPADARDIQGKARQMVEDARRRLHAARADAAAGPEAEEARRLTTLLAEAETALAAARQAHAEAVAARKQQWAEGRAAAEEEELVEMANKDVQRLTARVEHLRPQTAAAHNRAEQKAAQLLRETRAAVAAEWAAERRRQMERLRESMAGPLAEILSLDLSLNSLR